LQYFRQAGKDAEFVKKLEEQRARKPENRVLVQTLVSLYAARNQMSDAIRVLDETRKAMADDPDQLYFLAHLYEMVQHRETTETVLIEVLKLDPRHPIANNDLGYMWTDEGRNLEKAEGMIRIAVEAEPDNSAFLDSLGWLLYKRGKFEEASVRLQEAVSQGDRPDPVVLDHLADALYRLKKGSEAGKTWKQAMDRLRQTRSDREDLRKLQLELKRKLQQSDAGKSVEVAPTALEDLK
jgi:Tfp pilus assembly protein PilF